MNKEIIALSEFQKAGSRIEPVIHKTELKYSSTFSKMTGGNVYLKCENEQKTGSFKIRGASNKIAKMIENGDRTAVVASSAGNHAQGVAFSAARLGIESTIVMPENAPLAKIEATKGYGANVVLSGECYDDAYKKACEICESINGKFIHPYNDIDVITGQGTIGIEILEELPKADIIVVPAGGGGLLAGVSCAAKQINPAVKVIGVQATGADAIARSFKSKKLERTESAHTIADGIAVKSPGDISVGIIYKYVDDMVTVTDNEISNAILLLMERCKDVVEAAGAASLAAVLSGKIDAKGKTVVCLLSGGNIDVGLINNLIVRGLVARHRRVSIALKLPDKHGSLVKVLDVLSKKRANVLSIEQNMSYTFLDVDEVLVKISIEVSGMDHEKEIINTLKNLGYEIMMEDIVK